MQFLAPHSHRYKALAINPRGSLDVPVKFLRPSLVAPLNESTYHSKSSSIDIFIQLSMKILCPIPLPLDLLLFLVICDKYEDHPLAGMSCHWRLRNPSDFSTAFHSNQTNP